jgi:hypothetical protein
MSNALEFDGIDDNVSIPDNPSFDFSDFITASCWFKTGATDIQTMLTKHHNNIDEGWTLRTSSSGANVVWIMSNTPGFGNDDIITSDATYSTTGWNFVAGGFDGTNIFIYLNGTLKIALASFGFRINNTDLIIGASKSQAGPMSNFLGGQIAEPTVWNAGLTPSEMYELFNSNTPDKPLSIQPSNLIAYYPMDDQPAGTSADGDTVRDASGNNNNGTGDDGPNNTGLTWRAEDLFTGSGLDPATNFAVCVVSQGYDASATVIEVETGKGSKFPTKNFNFMWYNYTDFPNPTDDPDDDPNIEIARCTDRTGDIFTIDRAQEETTATDKNLPNKIYKIYAGPTKKTFDNIGNHINDVTNPHSVTLAQVGGTTDHTGLSNIGTNTHVQVDTHIADNSIHFSEGSIDHGSIGGLDDDDHGAVYGGLAQTEEITGTWTFNKYGDGGLTNYDLLIGNGAPSYGMIRIGNSAIGRTSFKTGNIDLDGAILYRNIGGPVTSQVEHIFTESGGNTCRFAIPKSGVGNATYNSRSMLIAGPAPADTNFVTVGYWQTNNNIFHNLVCDTGSAGADLGIQNDLEVEGDIFTDSIKESTPGAGISINDFNLTNVGDIALDTISSDSGTSISVILGTDAGDDFIVGNNNALVVTGDNDRVGIGTINPGDKLQVAGNVIIGTGESGIDYTLTFDGENNDGVITFQEDEKRFDFDSSVYLTQGVRHNVTVVTTTTYAILLTDYFIEVSTASAGDEVTVTLPDASDSGGGTVFVIKDIDDDRDIIVDTTGADTIDGETDATFKGLSSISVYSDGVSDWRIF